MTETTTPQAGVPAGGFPPGTFRPHPERASITRMVASQARIESLLFLRHGEQQLLNVIIPVAALLGLSRVNVFSLDNPVDTAVPFTFAIAGMSAGLSGQAIAVAFDRRYGALKRIGASGVPSWAIIAGKICAVLAVTLIQSILIGGIGMLLGWRPPLAGVVAGGVVMILGVAAFTCFGLLLGGTLSSEVVLALANLLWFVLVGIAGFALLPTTATNLLHAIPSVSFATGLIDATTGHLPVGTCLILVCWAVIGAIGAVRWFRFQD